MDHLLTFAIDENGVSKARIRKYRLMRINLSPLDINILIS
ncbi:hypothetical protein ECDEC8A_3277 [Escherichia coli DEC8A]|nr:hypothetical protein EC236275_0074 [Escherichia coli 2362-75]EHU45069.1 hypothetical protein ECDEC2C_2020 [Escherichia coli DEC2C]EHW08235.1 hypothetical protein ECDEC8A_3277 [Escherichia coli DEC8A]